MNWASARCRRATGPRRNEKREPDSLAPVSKSRPSGAPRSTWSRGAKSKLRGVPQRRTSTLALSSAPTGTLASGRLGSDISIVDSSAWIASSRAAERSSSPAMPFTSVISALASAPCAFFWPISFDRLLRRACSSSVRVCRPLRSDSRATEALDVEKGLRRLARLETGDDGREVLAQERDIEHGGHAAGLRRAKGKGSGL